MRTRFYYLACLLLIQFAANAQMKVGNNPTIINSASLLELETTNKGFVLPRVSISDVSTASPLPAGLLTGTIVYNTNVGTVGGSGVGIYIWDGAKWVVLSTGISVNSSAWLLTGNSGLSASTNFIGTTDAVDFVARTANIERLRILGSTGVNGQAGWVGIGIALPRSSLDVTGDYTNKNVITLQNTSNTGYSSVDMLDNSGALKGTFGYANPGTSGNFSSRDYFNTYGGDFLLTSNSGTSHFFMKGGTGYIGLNTTTPSERLHLVGNFYLNGAFMPGGDPGTSGYVLTSAGANTSPLWKSLSGLSWSLTGNSGTGYATNFLGTTDNISMRFRTNNIQRMIIDSLGRVGIGISNPSYALSVLSQINPLYLSGVQATATFSTDSVLTINGGVVKKAPYSSLTGSFWSLTGNSGTNYATNFLGTTNNASMRVRTNNTERMIIDSLGNVAIGTSVIDYSDAPRLSVDNAGTTSDDIMNLTGSRDGFIQVNIQNKSNGVNASGDYVATSDDGTDSTNYIDMGINSSTYAPGIENFGGPHDGYLYTYSRNLLIGAAALNSDVIFLLGGGRIKSNTVLRLKGENGNVVVGTGEGSTLPVGNTLRGPNAIASAINTAGGGLSVAGGSSTGTAAGGDLNITGGATAGAGTGGSVNITGGSTTGGTLGGVNINAGTNSATNINIGTSTGTVTLGNSLNNINLPKLSATSVVLTDAGKNLTSTTPSTNTYLYYNGSNFIWATAASSLASLTNGPGIASLNYNGSSAATVSLANGTAAGQVYVTGATPFTPSLVTMSGDAAISSAGALTLTTVNGNIGTFNNVTVNAKGLVTAASNIAYTTLGSFSATSPLTYNNLTGVFAINQATTLANGYLSSADWNTFNNKVGSITLNTPSSVFSNPINFSVSSGAATGTLSLNTQAAGTVFAGPVNVASGTLPAVPTFRALVAADIPSLAGLYIQNQTIQQASSNFNISGNGTIGGNLTVAGKSTLTGVTNTGTFTSSGGDANININSNNSTNINTGTSTSNVTIGNSANNILFPKFNTTGGMFFTAAGTGQISNTAANMTWDNANNRLGIGITSPSYKLSVLSASDPLYLSGVQATAAFTTDSVLTIFNGVVKKAPYSSLTGISWNLIGNSGTSYATNFLGTTDNISMRFRTNNVQRMIIDSLGNIGIGLNNPSYALSVLSAGNPLYLSGVQATATFIADSVLTINAGVVKKTPYSSLTNIGWSLTGNTGTTAGTNFIGTTDAVDFVIKTNGTERMRATSSGLVGIGTNAPASDLTIYQSSGSGSSRGFTFTGNSIGGTSSGTGFLMSLGYNTIGNKQLWVGDADYAGNASGSFARFVVSGASFPVLDAVSGNNLFRRYLAIGVAGDANSGVIFGGDNTAVNPGSQVWDNGNMAIGSGYKSYTAPSNGLLVQGNVGIGTTSPSSALSVLASSNPLYLSGVQATATFTTDSVLTINAGVVKKTPYSSLPGAGSGWSLTGNSGTTTATNFLGTTDLNGLVFKVNNIQAGYLGISGSSYATSLGVGSSGTSTGFQATAIGAGSQATANATLALGYNATASLQDDIAIGNSALANTNNEAIAIGHNAKASSFQGIALGVSATASTNNQTIAIGNGATASGSQGIAIGNGSSATTNNTTLAVGVSAIASGYQSTAIGNGTSATALNSTAIGNGAATSQANALVLGNSSTNVGIGTSTPNTTAKLDVAGSFKLGTVGSVLANVIKSSVTISPTVNLGTTTTYTATVTGATTGASVIVNPRSALASGVVVAYTYVSSLNTITIGLTSGSTTGALGSLTFDVTVIE